MMPFPTLEAQPKVSQKKSISFSRVASIDIVRALTMVLMIFVNDLWSLINIPSWLGHVDAGVDGIGLADVVFPAFLFIVGLSLPFAIDHRRKKGDTEWQLVKHVLARTVALLIMGVFLVNGETINASATGIPRYLWNPLCCVSFILIWNIYPKNANRYLVSAVKVAAIITLLVLAFIYRGGSDDQLYTFGPQWWGILGLIGWAYLASALVTIFAKNNLLVIIGAWTFFSGLSIVYKAGFIPAESFISFVPNAILGGTLTGLTISGVLIATIFKIYRKDYKNFKMTTVFLVIAAWWVILSLLTRPYWQLSKLGATPAWLFLCSAFTLLAFLMVYWIADVKRKDGWFNIIRPAGTDTLLCYLIPYFLYAIMSATRFQWPEVIVTGGIGLIKSFLFALLCVFITGWLNRAGIRLKL